MALRKLSEIKIRPKETGLVKRLLHAHVGGYELPRSKKNIHASELTYERDGKGFCPRQYRIMDMQPELKDKSRHVSTAEAVTYADGRAKQALLNNDWLRHIMVGDWKCASCGKVEKFTRAPQGGCNDPKLRCRWEYEEVRALDPITGLSGGLDGLLVVGEGKKLRLLECKILDKDMYRDQKGVYAEHKVRTQMYLRAIARCKEPWAKLIDTSEASVLYMLRGFGLKDENGELSPFREYVVERDDAATEVYFSMAHAVTLSRREPDRGFPCGLCKNMLAERAQGCPAAKPCFGTKYPATITWTNAKKPVHSGKHVLHIVDGTKIHDAQV